MRRFLLGVLLLAVIGSLMSCVTLISSRERAVVRRFGRMLPDDPRPGLLIGLPWGIDRVTRVSIESRSINIGWTEQETDENSVSMPPGQLLTGDHNLVNVEAVVEFRVNEEEVRKYVLMQDRVEPLLARAAEAALAEWLAGQKVDDAILKKQLQSRLRDRITDWIKPYELGIHVDLVSIMRIDPPAEVRKYFSEVSEAHSAQETQITQARQYEQGRKLRAAGDVRRIESNAAAYEKEQLQAARGDADGFQIRLAEYRRLRHNNPQLLNLLWLDKAELMFAQIRATGRLDVLDKYIGSDGLNISQFLPQKKR